MEISFVPTPLYYQIQQNLRAKILSGEIQPLELLPTEAQLCSEFGVSRITVGKALDALVAEQLIYRRRGVGTFVAERAQPAKSVTLTGSLDEMLAPVKNSSRKMLNISIVTPPALVAERLSTSDDVYCFESLHSSLDGVFSHARMFLPKAIGERISASLQSSSVPTINVIEVMLDMRIERASQTIAPVLCSAVIAKHLNIKKGAPVLEVTRTYMVSKGVAVGTVVATYDPDKYQYKIELYPRVERGQSKGQ